MQRLDAIASFITNKFSLTGSYFDLNTIAVTKALLDAGDLIQKSPVMDRDECVRIASYPVPLSIYEFADDGSVEEVFRRINSGGRQLSRQELRVAGATGEFATAVRRLSAKVRGDDSASDVLKLNDMQSISITNRDLDYGIDVDSVFWVAQGILSRDNVRKSRDEELVADLVSYMVSEDPIPSRSEFLDDFYGMSSERLAQERFDGIETAVKKRSLELITLDFQRVLDELKLTLAEANKTFMQLVFSKFSAPSPRYFQAVFLAMHDLLVKKNFQVKDRGALVSCLQNCADHIAVQEGSNWGVESRQKAIESAIGMIQKSFEPRNSSDPANIHWITQFENLLKQSYTEQSAYDFKQGFFRLSDALSFDDSSFEKILKTCVGIANIGRGHKGYVLVGVADNAETANRIERAFSTTCRSFDRFFVSGVEHEAIYLRKSLDQYVQLISDKVAASKVSQPLKSYITSNMKIVRYFDKTVFIFEVIGQENPSLYDSAYYERVGTQLKKLQPEEFPVLMERYRI